MAIDPAAAVPVQQAPSNLLVHYGKELARITAMALPIIAIAAATVHAPLAILPLAVTLLISSDLACEGFQNNWSAEATTRCVKMALIISGIVLGGVVLGIALSLVPAITLSLTARSGLAWYLETKYLGCCLLLGCASLEITKRAFSNARNLTSDGVQRLLTAMNNQEVFRPRLFFNKLELFTELLFVSSRILIRDDREITHRLFNPEQAKERLEVLLRRYNGQAARRVREPVADNDKLLSLLERTPAGDERREWLAKIVDSLIYRAVNYSGIINQRLPGLFLELANSSLQNFQERLNPLRQASDLVTQEIQEQQLLQHGRLGIHHADLVEAYQIYKRFEARNQQAIPQSLADFNQLYQQSSNLRLQIDQMRRDRTGSDIDESESVRTVLLAYCQTAEEALQLQNGLKAFLNITSNEEIDERLRELGLNTLGDLFRKELLTRAEYVNKVLLRERVLTALAEGTTTSEDLRTYNTVSPIQRVVSTILFRMATLNIAVLSFWIAPQTSFLGVAAGFVLYGAYKFYRCKIASPNSRLVNRITRMYNNLPDYYKYLRVPSVFLNMRRREDQAAFIHGSLLRKGIELGVDMLYAYGRTLVIKTALKTSRVFYALPFLNGVFVGADLVDMIST